MESRYRLASLSCEQKIPTADLTPPISMTALSTFGTAPPNPGGAEPNFVRLGDSPNQTVFSAAAFRPAMRPKTMHSVRLPPPW